MKDEAADPEVRRVSLELARYCVAGVSTLAKQGNIAQALVDAKAAGVREERNALVLFLSDVDDFTEGHVGPLREAIRRGEHRQRGGIGFYGEYPVKGEPIETMEQLLDLLDSTGVFRKRKPATEGG